MEDAVQARAGETTDSIPGFPAVSTRALTPEPLRHLPERERTKTFPLPPHEIHERDRWRTNIERANASEGIRSPQRLNDEIGTQVSDTGSGGAGPRPAMAIVRGGIRPAVDRPRTLALNERGEGLRSANSDENHPRGRRCHGARASATTVPRRHGTPPPRRPAATAPRRSDSLHAQPLPAAATGDRTGSGPWVEAGHGYTPARDHERAAGEGSRGGQPAGVMDTPARVAAKHSSATQTAAAAGDTTRHSRDTKRSKPRPGRPGPQLSLNNNDDDGDDHNSSHSQPSSSRPVRRMAEMTD
ncbi:unnamed protein product [Lampetra planeri]